MADPTDQTMDKVTEDLDDLSFDPTMKKKKPSSKKKTVAFDDLSTPDAAAEPVAAEEGILFLKS